MQLTPIGKSVSVSVRVRVVRAWSCVRACRHTSSMLVQRTLRFPPAAAPAPGWGFSFLLLYALVLTLLVTSLWDLDAICMGVLINAEIASRYASVWSLLPASLGDLDAIGMFFAFFFVIYVEISLLYALFSFLLISKHLSKSSNQLIYSNNVINTSNQVI